MVYEYTSGNGGHFVIVTPTPFKDRERREIERIVCAASSTDCISHESKETEYAPLD